MGGGGQGEHIHPGAHLFEFLLVGDPEPLFLVDDDKPQILELDVLLNDAVGADDDIDRTPAQAADDRVLLAGGAVAGEQLDFDREALHPAEHRLVVLPGEDGGRHQHRHLFAVHHRLKGGAEGDLGLAEADIAAEQPVHRRLRLHVVFDLGDAFELVVRLVVFEAGFEIPLPFGVGREGEAFRLHPLGVQLGELLGHVLDGRFDPAAGLLPFGAAELVQL